MVFNLPPGSITYWNDFEKSFIGKFGEEKTLMTLFKELVALKMEKKEKVKDFNQCFTTSPQTNSLVETAPLEPLVVEYYTSTCYFPL
jgi:hypothetical protein